MLQVEETPSADKLDADVLQVDLQVNDSKLVLYGSLLKLIINAKVNLYNHSGLLD